MILETFSLMQNDTGTYCTLIDTKPGIELQEKCRLNSGLGALRLQCDMVADAVDNTHMCYPNLKSTIQHYSCGCNQSRSRRFSLWSETQTKAGAPLFLTPFTHTEHVSGSWLGA